MIDTETDAEAIERLKQWHMDAEMTRDALQRENDALRSKLSRAHFMFCEVNAALNAQQTEDAHSRAKLAIRVLA